MSNFSTSYTEQDVEDFIIPDEEEVPKQTQSTAAPQTQSNSQPQSFFPSMPWNAKVDLSTAFSPFTTSSAFNENNVVREHQYTGGDTLDEPVWKTLSRDLLNIWKRLTIVIWPAQLNKLAQKQQNRLIDFAQRTGVGIPESIIRERRISVHEEDVDLTNFENIEFNSLDWDLWGPLIFLLVYSMVLGFSASSKQTNSVFSGSFTFIWVFYIVIGLNIQLLGGNISFLSAISAVGYSMFPITVGEIICSLLLRWKLIRLAVMFVLCAWSIYSGILSLKCLGVLPGRVLLAVYPVGLMYAVLSWLTVIT